MAGTVFLVGAGPGDPGLITVKGHELIKKADVIVYDRLVNKHLMRYTKHDCEKIYVGKLPDKHTMTQENINCLLVELAQKYDVVVRLKGGDPCIFARGGEEAEYCVDHNVSFEFVPGITSAIAVPAYAGIPLSHRETTSSIAIVTGHENPKKIASSLRWKQLASATDTIVFLMGMSNLGYIVDQLISNGRDTSTPIALIRWGTRSDQVVMVGTLEDIVHKSKELSSPVVIVVGDVVNLQSKLSWFDRKLLFGKKILVTRARAQSSCLSKKIAELGGEAIEFPSIKIAPANDNTCLDNSLKNLNSFSWLIFTSVNGVNYFFDRIKELKLDIRKSYNAKIAAIGPATATALEEKGLFVDLVPSEYKAEDLFESLEPFISAEDKILLARSEIARPFLADRLSMLGCQVIEAATYSTLIEELNEESLEAVDLLTQGEIDIVTFTSSSTVKNFVSKIGSLDKIDLRNTQIACIGPITAQTAKDMGLRVDHIADEYTIDGLLSTICKEVSYV